MKNQEKQKPYCCFIPCDKGAEFEIRDGETPDDYTHSCTEHVGSLLQAGKVSTVYELSLM